MAKKVKGYNVQYRINAIKEKKFQRELLNRAGIYAIVNIVNGNKYIGQSKHIGGRWESHLQSLHGGHHGNPHLQHAFNLYGERKFIFCVLEIVPCFEELNEREQYWIDILKPEYNILLEIGKIGGMDKNHTPLGFYDEIMYRNPNETFDRPEWHKWVYGGEKGAARQAK